METGRLHEAEAQFQYVETIVRNPRSQDHLDLWRYAQHLFHSYGELWLCRGDYAKAFDYADACLSLADPGCSQKYQVKGRRLRGEVLIAQGHLTKAERELDMALQTAVALGNPPQLWKTQARRAELRLRQGRSSEARQAFEAALAEIEAVAAGLMDETLRTRFLGASDIQHIRQMLEQQGL
jgi:tetratricopeptide (TPR) repeat protein